MSTINCLCPVCRRGVRLAVERTFEVERRWLGKVGVRFFGVLDWVTPALLDIVLAEMCERGILIEMLDHPGQQRRPISMYMLARLTVPVEFRKRGGA